MKTVKRKWTIDEASEQTSKAASPVKTLICDATVMAFAALLTAAMPARADAVATAPGQNKLLCFDGPSDGTIYGGHCTLKANGAKGPATLDNTDSDPDGDYSGVYIQNTSVSGQLLGNITQLGYSYSGITVPSPGNLSLNLPLDTNGDNVTDAYAFIDAFYAPGVNGNVDVIHDQVCGIFVNGIEYENWAALVAAHPTWTVGSIADVPNGFGTLPFVIAERTPAEPPALWTVGNVTLGKGGK
jgi:hypothetical protein